MIHASPTRKVKQYQLFTLTGFPVYGYGRKGFTITKTLSSLPCRELESIDSEHSKRRAVRASEYLGQPVEWRRIEDTEVFDIYF